MLESIKMWLVTILISAFIVNIVDMLLPKSKLKPYINMVINFLFVFMVLTPIISFFSGGRSLEDTILSSMNKYNKEYLDSINNFSKTSDNLNDSYENGVREVIKLKLGEYGYELEDIEFKDSNIYNIKVKNSNNEEGLDIESREKENSKEVFSDNKSETEKLKDDLVDILDISIESIQIDI